MAIPSLTGSPQLLARVAGLCQLLESATATFGQVFVTGRLVVAGNATATAAQFLGHERLFWIGFGSSLAGVFFHLAWALLLYYVFRPVSRGLSLFALAVILVGCAVQALTCVFYLAPMLVLNAGSSLSNFTVEQLQALAYVFVRLNGYAFNTYLVFFGMWCALTGVLIAGSTFMPRIVGILLVISGLGWMMYLVPPVAIRLFIPYIAGASAIGEIPLMVWLLVMGVNAEQWNAQARAAALHA